MSVRLTSQENKVAMFDSVTDTAFGPVWDSEEEANQFLDWHHAKFPNFEGDLRNQTDQQIINLITEWKAEIAPPQETNG